MRKIRRIKRKVKYALLILIIIIVMCVVAASIYYYKINNKKKIELEHQASVSEIKKHYNNYVKTNKKTDLYIYNNDKYIKAGNVEKNIELALKKQNIKYNTSYFEIIGFNKKYYVYYKDVDAIEELTKKSDRYKKYIPYNKNIVSKDKVQLYNQEGNLLYTLPEKLDSAIIINQDDFYGIEYNDELLYIKNESIDEIKDNKNTDNTNTPSIATLNYHFFYDESETNTDCNQIICLSLGNLKKHLEYITENGIFTPTMKEFEMYLDSKIQLPKSVVITIDDGWRADLASPIFAEYKVNATVFLVTAYYDPVGFQNEYVETHSHSHALHEPGMCPGGQGGGIKCLSREKILDDLNASREKLNNTTYFCYPFYEYNNYSIELLKEAGFTMAFGGYNEGGHTKAYPGIDKFKIPRYIIYDYTTAANIANYIQ